MTRHRLAFTRLATLIMMILAAKHGHARATGEGMAPAQAIHVSALARKIFRDITTHSFRATRHRHLRQSFHPAFGSALPMTLSAATPAPTRQYHARGYSTVAKL